jgi:Tol biopolymer transport system component
MRVTSEPKSIFGGAMLLLSRPAGGVSPDGKWITFSNLGTQEDIFLARTDGSENRQLTNDPEKDRGGTWSPDGKLLYFYSQRGKRYEVWTIRFDGSGLRQVSRTSGASMWFPRIMPDGRAILEFNNTGTYLLPLNPDGTSTRIEPLPPMPDPKKHFMTPTVSPDGKHLAGATGQLDGGIPGIWVYSFESKQYEHLTDRGFYPVWMPDGKRLLFLDGTGLSVIDVASKQIRSIPVPRAIRWFDVAPDFRTLYLAERVSEADVWMVTSK